MFNNHVRKTFIKLIVTNCNVRLKSLTMHYINQLIFQEVYLILWSLSTKISLLRKHSKRGKEVLMSERAQGQLGIEG